MKNIHKPTDRKPVERTQADNAAADAAHLRVMCAKKWLFLILNPRNHVF